MTTGGGPRVTELPNDLTKDIDKCDPLVSSYVGQLERGSFIRGWGW